MVAELDAGLLFCCQYILLLDTQVLKLCILGPVASGGNNCGACSVMGTLLDSRVCQCSQLSCMSVLFFRHFIL